MAVVGSASELPDSPKVSGGINERTYTRKFLVTTDDKNTGLLAIINAPGIPKLYSEYSFGGEVDYFARMRHIDAARVEEGAFQWVVTCSFSTPDPESHNDASKGATKQEKSGEQDNPTLVIPEIDVSFERFQEVVYGVYNVDTQKIEPCKASNGQVFDPPPTKDAARMIVQITRNESIASAHPATGLTYMDAVNSDYWFGMPPGTWKIQSIVAKRATKQLAIGGVPILYPYLTVTYKMEGRGVGWDLKLLDAGAYYLDDRGGPDKLKVKFTVEGHPVIGALDGNGGKLPEGSTPVFKTFRLYPRLPFSALNLPQAFIDFR